MDISICEGKLFQHAVEYIYDEIKQTAVIIKPIYGACPLVQIMEKAKPEFSYGDIVSPLNHPEMTGLIREIIWHFNSNRWNYYITVKGRKKSKRYYAEELIKIYEVK